MASSKAILEPGKAVRLEKANQAAFPAKGPRSRTQTNLVAQVRCLAAPANFHPSTLSETAPKTP